VGNSVGKAVGILDGENVGMAVEGVSVGKCVGISEGGGVGSAIGVRVGSPGRGVGAFVLGVIVGIGVGE
jgi:hypothetical protein